MLVRGIKKYLFLINLTTNSSFISHNISDVVKKLFSATGVYNADVINWCYLILIYENKVSLLSEFFLSSYVGKKNLYHMGLFRNAITHVI